MNQIKRNKFLNLFILAPKMSITAKVSILHRITGFFLFLSIPAFLYLLNQTLTNSDFYSSFYSNSSSILAKSVYIILIFMFVYHMCAGVRYLFLDLHKGVEINTAKKTAWLVIIFSLLITIFLGIMVW
jgi:succinate dehydrogenase / fumarate reductase cytochrome b subunit